MGYLSPGPPPDERLVQLVQAEEQWQRGEQHVVATAAQMPVCVDADGSHDDPTYEVGLRRKAHSARYCPFRVRFPAMQIIVPIVGAIWIESARAESRRKRR